MYRNILEKVTITGLYLLLLPLSSVFGQQESGYLRLNLKAGDLHRMAVQFESNTKTSMIGMDLDFRHMLMMHHEFRVEMVDRNGRATVRATYKRIQLNTHADGLQGIAQDISYDSAIKSDANNQIAPLFNAIIGKQYTMTIASSGRIVEILGLKEIIASALKTVNPEHAPLYEPYLNDRVFQEMMEYMFYIYPDKPVAAGDSWNRTNRFSQGYTLELNTTYTLQSRTNSKSRISVNGSMQSVPGAQLPGAVGVSMNVSMDGTHSGYFTVDTITGWVQNGTITQNLSGEMSLGDSGLVSGMFGFPITVGTTITISSQ